MERDLLHEFNPLYKNKQTKNPRKPLQKKKTSQRVVSIT